MSEKKIDLIAQLLAKAESTTPEEAEALMEHAERLMIKYGIEQAVIDAKRAGGSTKAEKIVTETLNFEGVYRGEMINLGFAIVSSLGSLRALRNGNSGAKVVTLWIIGFESDVAQAKQLIASLEVQAMVAMAAWWKGSKEDFYWNTALEKSKARRAFINGFSSGAGKRIRDSRATIIQEAGTGTEMVLVGRDQKVQAYMDENIRARRSRAGMASDHRATGQGFAAGQRANTGGQAVGQGRGISA